MEIIHSLETVNNNIDSCVMALGTFDGLHLGHQDVIKTAKQYAEKHNCKLAVFTFSNHPFSLINPQAVPSTLISLEDRYTCLEKMGVDLLLEIPFDNKLANLSPEDFIAKLRQFKFCSLVVGENFSFGFHGQGNINTLAAFAEKLNFELIVRPLVKLNDTVVSSTVIRKLVMAGNVDLVRAMLNRPYSISGIVVHGDERGRLLNFPTANIELSSEKLTIPAKGVYAVLVKVGENVYQGMSNIGINPTFTGTRSIRLETNIFDFAQDIYGQKITVDFYRFTRGEKRFTSIDELKNQLCHDKNECREILKNIVL